MISPTWKQAWSLISLLSQQPVVRLHQVDVAGAILFN